MTNCNPRLYGDLFEIKGGLIFKDYLVSQSKFEKNDGTENGAGVSFSSFGCSTDGTSYLSYDQIGLSGCFTASIQFRTDTLQDCLLFGSNDYLGTAANIGFTIKLQSDATILATFYNAELDDIELSLDIDYSDDKLHTITIYNDVDNKTFKLFCDELSTQTTVT